MKSELRKRERGRFNAFQRAMLQWDELHPYNAVHVVRLFEVLDAGKLREAIERTLAGFGLSGWTLDGGGTFSYQGGATSCELTMVDSADTPALHAEIERQLNLRFAWREHCAPFRFFAAEAEASFALGLVYFHPVADAESVVRLMRSIVEAYQRAGQQRRQSLELYPAARDKLLQHPEVLAKKLTRFPSLLRRMRQSCRPAYADPLDLENGFRFFSCGPEILAALIATSKAWEVTLNDLFLALLMKSLAPLMLVRSRKGKRKRLSVGCIVNTRRDLGLDNEATFGLFLGSFILSREVPEGTSLRELAIDISAETRLIKRNRLYLGIPLEMAFGRLMLPLFSTERRKKLYQKHYPLWGGITNMNLNALWAQSDGPRTFDYFRAVSTGPVTPLVLSVTTAGERINIGVTYRRTVFRAPDLEAIEARFVERAVTIHQAI